MYIIGQPFFVACTVGLRNDHTGAGGQPGKKTNDQIDDLCCRASDTGQRIGSDKATDNDHICCVI